MFLQTQKMPDENYVRDAENALLRLQLRKSKRVIKELEAYLKDATPDVVESEDYDINFKVYQVLIVQRNEIAEKLGTVTL
jgi:predicted transcriptional regulator